MTKTRWFVGWMEPVCLVPRNALSEETTSTNKEKERGKGWSFQSVPNSIFHIPAALPFLSQRLSKWEGGRSEKVGVFPSMYVPKWGQVRNGFCIWNISHAEISRS